MAESKINMGKVFGGAILLLVAIYIAFLMPTTDITTKYFGGGAVGLISIFLLFTGYKGK